MTDPNGLQMRPAPERVAVLVDASIATLHRRYPQAMWLDEQHVRRVAAEEVLAELRGRPLDFIP
jgi:hypothetical protein